MADVEYSSNNSGGDWWLRDQDWYALDEAGWEVDWYKNRDSKLFQSEDGRFLGALASGATKRDTTLGEAIAEWESITGQASNELGCSCCGVPHSFSSSDGEFYRPEYPSYGERY